MDLGVAGSGEEGCKVFHKPNIDARLENYIAPKVVFAKYLSAIQLLINLWSMSVRVNGLKRHLQEKSLVVCLCCAA